MQSGHKSLVPLESYTFLNLSLRESLAIVMKHSVSMQQKYHDERQLEQKKEKALDLLSSMVHVSRTLGEDSVEVLSEEDEAGSMMI